MAMHVKNENDTQKKKRPDKRGFYAALAVCVLAIGIAAWSTYDTMSDFFVPADNEAESEAEPDVVTEPDVLPDDPEPTVSAGHGHGTASTVETEAEPEDTPVESVAAPTEEPAEVPVEMPQAEPEPEEAAAPVQTFTESEKFGRPVNGELLSAYSEAPVYSETMRDYRMHTGADYKAEHGETVHAAANGIVKSTHTDMLLGNMIVIDHGGAEISYCGLGETFLVKPGEVVEAGQDIGSITAAPFESSMEPHLHLEAVQHGKTVDPETLFE